MTDWLEKLANKQTLSVSQLNNTAKYLLESQFQTVWVEGEISNFSRPASGHWYFTLKDRHSQIRCAMFKGKNIRIQKLPKNGDAITLRGTVSLYAPRGDYQLIADNIIDDGAGKLQQAFDELKRKLDQKGWFNEASKQTIPTRPANIAVITSETGAVWHDIQNAFKRRNPFVNLYLSSVSVQGDKAIPEILSALKNANKQVAKLDAIILARGGGSLEDLAAFNSEEVATAVYESQLPTVVAIGHETDFSIAEFVADKRASTPTAAAELLSPDIEQDVLYAKRLEQRLQQGFIRIKQQKSQQLIEKAARLKHPQTRIDEQRQRIDELSARLQAAAKTNIANAKLRNGSVSTRLKGAGPQTTIESAKQKLSHLRQNLDRSILRQQQNATQQFKIAASMLSSVSPLATLDRGYAIIKDSNGKALTSSSQLTPRLPITINLQDGTVGAEIKDI